MPRRRRAHPFQLRRERLARRAARDASAQARRLADPVGPGRELAPERFELGDRVLDDGFDSVAEAARFSVEGGGRRIEVTFARGYPCAQVFAPAAGQFICFEPMTAPANALRSGDGLRLLAPGETFAARFAVAVGDSG